MPTPTYQSLVTETLGSTDSSITLSGIPSEYRDLVLVVAGQITGSAGLRLRLNNDSSSVYNAQLVRNNGTNPIQVVYTGLDAVNPSDVGLAADTPFMYVCNIMEYSTSKHKPLILKTDTNGTLMERAVWLYGSTSVVNEINIFLSANSYKAGTTISLYGILGQE